MDAARDLLGVRYHITGEIVHGAELGRTIGFPTINMDALPVNADGFPVLEGVYAVFVHGLAEEPLRGVASITTRPTVTEAKKYLLETHIFEYTKDCYGAFARIEFVRKIRNADKFDDLSALTRAITNDALTAKQMLEDPSTTPSITRFTLSKDALKTIF